MKNFTLIIILTTLCFLGCKETDRTEIDSAEIDEIEILEVKVDSLMFVNDSLTDVLTILAEEKPQSNYWYDDLYDGRALLKKGIAEPAEFIEKSLREKPELIPLKAVLGGTMHFGKIQPLGSKWVIVYYDDGHIEGRAIYKYKLNKKGELEFELLDSFEPQ